MVSPVVSKWILGCTLRGRKYKTVLVWVKGVWMTEFYILKYKLSTWHLNWKCEFYITRTQAVRFLFLLLFLNSLPVFLHQSKLHEFICYMNWRSDLCTMWNVSLTVTNCPRLHRVNSVEETHIALRSCWRPKPNLKQWILAFFWIVSTQLKTAWGGDVSDFVFPPMQLRGVVHMRVE